MTRDDLNPPTQEIAKQQGQPSRQSGAQTTSTGGGFRETRADCHTIAKASRMANGMAAEKASVKEVCPRDGKFHSLPLHAKLEAACLRPRQLKQLDVLQCSSSLRTTQCRHSQGNGSHKSPLGLKLLPSARWDKGIQRGQQVHGHSTPYPWAHSLHMTPPHPSGSTRQLTVPGK